jgi:ring-1,2-phenylacetyl-CoA epoxidase subunit PaaD
MHRSREKILAELSGIEDPEIPVLNIVEMGIVKGIDITDNNVQVSITPTYSGCPAMKVIEDQVISAIEGLGFDQVKVKTVFFPPWSTDDMTSESKSKLREYGIAPPENKHLINSGELFSKNDGTVTCPFCDSTETILKSFFGSTSCKSLYYCNNCSQPFEHFKCI